MYYTNLKRDTFQLGVKHSWSDESLIVGQFLDALHHFPQVGVCPSLQEVPEALSHVNQIVAIRVNVFEHLNGFRDRLLFFP